MSATSAYLDPARGRRNLAIVTHAHVLKIDAEGRRAVGATFRRHGQTVGVRAGREVILCAGGVQTPHILDLSGIGHPTHLKPLGIEIVLALPGVGENYQDHFCTRMNWRVNRPITLNEQSRGLPLARSVLQYVASGRGILSLGTGLAFGFVKTRPGLKDADAQLSFMHVDQEIREISPTIVAAQGFGDIRNTRCDGLVVASRVRTSLVMTRSARGWGISLHHFSHIPVSFPKKAPEVDP
ncbi:GMC family oxidoreductase N-terminal domain-containing protein [Ancylobacter polymorphus]|uniref:Choline dehydrogenase-like flavoprotein n=1 Tax=Ancylobacter polymorphus TaxID=223390 RepID=A0ABU0BIM7_9HYPH|nr:choline dehydrogenase-like flavoprotein [Ancylobacter polymorphus]